MAAAVLHETLGDLARQTWRDRALCKGRPNLIRGGYGDEKRRNVCFRCPALDPCRMWALALPGREDSDDIAGGLTAAQRRSYRIRAATRKARPLVPPAPTDVGVLLRELIHLLATACGVARTPTDGPGERLPPVTPDQAARNKACLANTIKEAS